MKAHKKRVLQMHVMNREIIIREKANNACKGKRAER